MRKKVFFIFPAMFRFVLFGIAEDCFAGVSSQFEQAYKGHVRLRFARPISGKETKSC